MEYALFTFLVGLVITAAYGYYRQWKRYKTEKAQAANREPYIRYGGYRYIYACPNCRWFETDSEEESQPVPCPNCGEVVGYTKQIARPIYKSMFNVPDSWEFKKEFKNITDEARKALNNNAN